MTSSDREDIKQMLHDVLTEYKAINDETHATHHAFIEMMISKEERKQQRWESIKTQVGGWGIVLVLAFIGQAVWKMAVSVITRG